MSGAKFVIPLLAADVLMMIALQNEREGQAAQAVRMDAAEAERVRRLEETRTGFLAELQEAFATLRQADALEPAHAARLRPMVEALRFALEQAGSERELWRLAPRIPGLLEEVRGAARNRAMHRQIEARHIESALHGRYRALEAGFTAVPEPEGRRFDPVGQAGARAALAAARAAVESDNSNHSENAEAVLADAAKSVGQHARAVAEHKAAWRQQQGETQHALSELAALVAGLKADPIVGRWHSHAVVDLDRQARERAGSERAVAFLAEANARANTLVEEARAAQLAADRRDYIVRGIAASLADMGFLVGAPAAEHPDHPATAKILQAASASGKSIAVSVPVQGQIWYALDGYPLSTETTLSGDPAVSCDEGEAALSEMHRRLARAFHVETGEITWEDRDPERLLRKADQLPVSADRARHGSAP